MSLFLVGAGFDADAKRQAGSVHCRYPLVGDVALLSFGLAQAPFGKSVEDLFAEALEGNNYAPLQKLYDRLMEADYALAWGLARSDRSDCFSEFFRAFPDASFLTFNYDSLPEIFLFRLGRWYPHDGYGLPVEAQLSPLKPTEFAALKSTSLVLHLHGSFCVYPCEFEVKPTSGDGIAWLNRLERPRYGFDPESIGVCFNPYRCAMPSTGRVPIEERVIAPIPDKAEGLKQPFISETYCRACSLVRESGILVAVGYSFNSYDRPSYQPVLQALDESCERKLIVVSPQAGELVDKIRAEFHALQVKPINKTFKGWAANSFRC